MKHFEITTQQFMHDVRNNAVKPEPTGPFLDVHRDMP
jgi:hypothetical protein